MKASSEPKVHQILKYSVMFQIKNLWIQHLTASPRLCFEPSLLLKRGVEHRIQGLLNGQVSWWDRPSWFYRLVLDVQMSSKSCSLGAVMKLEHMMDEMVQSQFSLFICVTYLLCHLYFHCTLPSDHSFFWEWEERIARKGLGMRKKVGY